FPTRQNAPPALLIGQLWKRPIHLIPKTSDQRIQRSWLRYFNCHFGAAGAPPNVEITEFDHTGTRADVRQRLLRFHDGVPATTTAHGYTPSTGGAPGHATEQMSPQLRHR